MTVAENGIAAKIYIYDDSNINIISTCSSHTEKTLLCINYDRSGELLASHGGEPDYIITIWNWRNSSVLLRSHSYPGEVKSLHFSAYNECRLVSGGADHIRFWDMSHTFTGLKLQYEDGRFGKVEPCDILGICLMKNGRTLTNCKWGNILVWENGTIKFEVCQKNGRPCHRKSITQIYNEDDRVMTIGLDGFIRIWYWDTVNAANLCENQKFVEIDPTAEYNIGDINHCCALLSMIKDVNNEVLWYAQDGNGGIWKCNLSNDINVHRSEILFRCHAGGVAAAATSPISEHIATLGNDGRLHVYDYISGKLLFHHQFPAGGRTITWISKTVILYYSKPITNSKHFEF